MHFSEYESTNCWRLCLREKFILMHQPYTLAACTSTLSCYDRFFLLVLRLVTPCFLT